MISHKINLKNTSLAFLTSSYKILLQNQTKTKIDISYALDYLTLSP